MRSFLFAFGIVLALFGLAQAQVWIMSPSGGGRAIGAGGGAPPPVCSNSLDFTDACNSQYITVI